MSEEVGVVDKILNSQLSEQINQAQPQERKTTLPLACVPGDKMDRNSFEAISILTKRLHENCQPIL